MNQRLLYDRKNYNYYLCFRQFWIGQLMHSYSRAPIHFEEEGERIKTDWHETKNSKRSLCSIFNCSLFFSFFASDHRFVKVFLWYFVCFMLVSIVCVESMILEEFFFCFFRMGFFLHIHYLHFSVHKYEPFLPSFVFINNNKD